MICPVCGKEYGERNRYCISCGNELVANDIITETEDIAVTDKKTSIIDDGPNLDETDTSASVREFEQRSNITHITNNIIDDTVNDNDDIIPFIMQDEIINDANTVPIAVNSADEPFAVKLGLGAVSLVTALLMLSFLVFGMGSYIGMLLTDESNIERFVKQTDLLSIPAESLNLSAVNDETVLDAIYTMSVGSGVTKETIREVYDSSTVKDFLSENLACYAGYIRTGNNPYRLTTDSVKQVYNDNLPLINVLIGTELNEHDINMAYEEIDKFAPVLDVISVNDVSSGLITPLRIYISMPVFITLTSLAVFMIILIFVINKKSSRSLKWCGIPMFLLGGTILVSTFLVCMRVISIDIGSDFASSMIYDITKIISGNLYLIGGGMTLLSVVFLLLSAMKKKAL